MPFDAHQFEDQERMRHGLAALLTRLHEENTSSRRGYPAPALPHQKRSDPKPASMPPSSSQQILGIAEQLTALAANADGRLRESHTVGASPIVAPLRFPARMSWPEDFAPSLLDWDPVRQTAELRLPETFEVNFTLDPLTFLGPPPQLPVFDYLPLRHRYYGSFAETEEPEPIQASVAEMDADQPEPASPEGQPVGLAGLLATMVTKLRVRGKE